MSLHKYRIVLLGGGMVAGYAAKEFADAGLKKRGDSVSFQPIVRFPASGLRCLRAFLQVKRMKRVC